MASLLVRRAGVRVQCCHPSLFACKVLSAPPSSMELMSSIAVGVLSVPVAAVCTWRGVPVCVRRSFWRRVVGLVVVYRSSLWLKRHCSLAETSSSRTLSSHELLANIVVCPTMMPSMHDVVDVRSPRLRCLFPKSPSYRCWSSPRLLRRCVPARLHVVRLAERRLARTESDMAKNVSLYRPRSTSCVASDVIEQASVMLLPLNPCIYICRSWPAHPGSARAGSVQ